MKLFILANLFFIFRSIDSRFSYSVSLTQNNNAEISKHNIYRSFNFNHFNKNSFIVVKSDLPLYIIDYTTKKANIYPKMTSPCFFDRFTFNLGNTHPIPKDFFGEDENINDFWTRIIEVSYGLDGNGEKKGKSKNLFFYSNPSRVDTYIYKIASDKYNDEKKSLDDGKIKRIKKMSDFSLCLDSSALKFYEKYIKEKEFIYTYGDEEEKQTYTKVKEYLENKNFPEFVNFYLVNLYCEGGCLTSKERFYKNFFGLAIWISLLINVFFILKFQSFKFEFTFEEYFKISLNISSLVYFFSIYMSFNFKRTFSATEAVYTNLVPLAENVSLTLMYVISHVHSLKMHKSFTHKKILFFSIVFMFFNYCFVGVFSMFQNRKAIYNKNLLYVEEFIKVVISLGCLFYFFKRYARIDMNMGVNRFDKNVNLVVLVTYFILQLVMFYLTVIENTNEVEFYLVLRSIGNTSMFLFYGLFFILEMGKRSKLVLLK